MVIFNNVTKCFGDNSGLINASVHIHRGDFVFLVGPSGAGKTTFIRLILKELDPDSGKIVLSGKDITKLPRREIPELRQKIGMVFQDFRLLEKKTVYENVAFAMEVIHKKKKEIKQRVPYVLKLMDIEDKADRYPDELSAGEQQRVGIARAIVNQPRILICDEPTGNLDPATAMDIMSLIEQINVRGTTVLMVTHAKDIVDRMKKRVVAIDKGYIVRDEEGSYGFRQEDSEEELYDPSVGYNPEVNIDSSAMGGKFIEDSSAYGIRSQDFEKSEDNQRDTTSIVDAYLNAGEEFYDE
ncbi:MAG TPA: cell division ATP-binding protein FtsE [Mogibacterium sp.]|nr:cell division ATP-binding protein FtsE [Mogibacterium sp.]